MKQTDKSFNTKEEFDINIDLSNDFEPFRADIDAALSALADACNSGVDFDAIKARAAEASMKRKPRDTAKHSARKSFIKYIACAAAAFLVCFGVVTLLKANKDVGEPGNNQALSTQDPSTKSADGTSVPETEFPNNLKDPEETTEPFMVSAYMEPFSSCTYVGELSKSVKSPDSEEALIIGRSYIDDTLSSYMNCSLIKDNNKVYARDRSDGSDEKYYECSIVDDSPYKLKLGEMGEFRGSGGSNYVFYWRVTDYSYVRIKLFGFDRQTAQIIVNDLCHKIIEPDSDGVTP